MAKLKAFAGRIFLRNTGQCQCVVAATSQAKAASILKVSLGEIRNYFSLTGNEKDIEIALSKPGTVFIRLKPGDGYQELSPEEVR